MAANKSLDELLAADNAQTALDTRQDLLQEDHSTLRLSREATTRAAEEEETYTPQEALPTIDMGPEWATRWVRVSVFGVADAANFAKQSQDGWVPINPSENPDLAARCRFHKSNESNQDLIELAGLVACKMPMSRAKARERYYDEKARGAYNQKVAEMTGQSNDKIKMGVYEQSFKSSRNADG